MENKKVEIYKTKEGGFSVDVTLEKDTVWLTQKQMGELFDKNVRTINEHIGNVYQEQELSEGSTIRKSRIVQKEGNRTVERQVEHYNLDVIISVGYRVKSKRGTEFRIWANNVLKQYLINGYAINENKLKNQTEKIKELENSLTLLSNAIEYKELKQDEAIGLVKVIKDYSYALDLLDKYDHDNLEVNNTNLDNKFKITYENARNAINKLGEKFKQDGENLGLFGNEKDESFKSSIGAIYQTFGGEELYPSIEEKAAHLLYFVIKNHSFSDGNKRIGAFLFIWFLEKNNSLYNKDGSKRLKDNALVALTIMIAVSHPKEKDTIVKIIISLINQKN